MALSLFLGACSGVKMIVRESKEGLYGNDFTAKIEEIKRIHRMGNVQLALERLKTAFNYQDMLPAERAARENFIGVIYFSQGRIRQGIGHFEAARSISHSDRELAHQIDLNLASSQYKLRNPKGAYNILAESDGQALEARDYGKYHRLRYSLAKELGYEVDAIVSLIRYFRDIDAIVNLKSDKLFEELLVIFHKLDDGEKFRLLDRFADEGTLAVGYLGHLETERLYYGGKNDEALRVLRWLENHYGDSEIISALVVDSVVRLRNYAKIDSYAVGVVLPLTGSGSEFGKKALLGIDSALKIINKDLAPGRKIRLIVRDSKASGIVGAHRVRELVEGYSVSLIIGGLFSGSAIEEYFTARKSGVFFLSLSQIDINKEQKNHLLLEVPGSLESQLHALFEQNIIKKLGKRVAIVYPEGSHGQAYLDEFWKRAKLADLNVTGVVSFREGDTDYRAPVRRLLGLDYDRERKEEYDLLNEIYSLEKSGTVRRIQTLEPQIDFDWVFIPSLPRETLQIVPAFSYFDAFELGIVGIPSWRTQTVIRENSRHKALYFVGEYVDSKSNDYAKKFMKIYKKRPGAVELRAYDSLMIASNLIGKEPLESRDVLDKSIRSKGSIVGLTGRWRLDDGVWIKEMGIHKIFGGEVETLR